LGFALQRAAILLTAMLSRSPRQWTAVRRQPTGREQLYAPDGALTHRAVQAWALRTKGDPGRTLPSRAQMTIFDRSISLNDVQTMETIVNHAQTYGVLSTVVRQRTAEIGVRMALGAAPNGIFGLMIGCGLRLSAVGITAGLMAALLLTRAMGSMLVGIKPTDPLTFAGMAALFFLIAGLATWIPARRAAALDPSAALREE
jgi:hypothetical protein